MTPAELAALLDENPPDLVEQLAPLMEWRAVLILDMCGFSSSARQGGIIDALKRQRDFQRFSQRAVESYGGYVVKFWADNAMASFSNMVSARLAAATAVSRGNAGAGLCGGIVLVLEGDLYGVAVNAAAKLGEDEAKGGEVLEATTASLGRG